MGRWAIDGWVLHEKLTRLSVLAKLFFAHPNVARVLS